jgi:hypothetical protein
LSKPIISLKKNKPETEAKPEVETKSQMKLEEIPVNPLAAIEVVIWDYTPEEEFSPRQRRRRKDRQIEQYRKESKWQ